MAIPQKLKGRYEIKEVLGQGGMGIVFRAYDAVVKRDVALKTLRDAPTRAGLQMFYKECEVLAALSHPNIIELFDVGEYEEDGKSKPYFVMPLLPGAPLDKLIRSSSQRLTVQRVVDIICQTCRGLHAAHERGLIHRDIKPSNLFVADDDSVKIIDFGVAHMVEQGMTAAKGTLLYMAPEQLQMKPPSPASDIYALGVVCYEAFTRRRPFDGPTEMEIVEAVLHQVPPPACDLNPAISQVLSRAVHKAMAKQPWNRYANAREFADTLQKALRNEPIEFFSQARIQPRIERATKAFEQGDLQFASEILSEMEAEGHIDPAIPPLRRQIEHSRRQKTIGQLLDSARTRFEQDEYPLALQKIEEILQIDPAHGPALGLRTSIENKLTAQKIEEWFRLAGEHIDNQAFGHARDALQNVLQLKSNESRALQLLAEVDRLEQDYLRLRKEKEELYGLALEAWNSGEVSSALGKIERVLELNRRYPEASSSERSAAYQTFYNKIRTEHDSLKNSYAEARKLLADRNFTQALAVADEWLAKYPGHALFQALKFDIEEQQRQELSSRIAEIDRQVDAEPDLDRRVHIIEQAVAAYPGEPHFERQLRPTREKRDLVNSIIAKARYHEERGQFSEALAQLDILRTIYSQHPGLDFEIERVQKRREQQSRADAKALWVEQIDRAMDAGEYPRAMELFAGAEAEFPNDAELAQLKELARQAAARAGEAQELLAQGQELCRQEWFDEGIGALRKAYELDPRNPPIRTALLEALIGRSRALLDKEWQAAEPLIQQALEIDPGNLLAKSLRTAVQDHKRDEAVVRCFSTARRFRAAGDLRSALAEAEQCLAQYPLDPRLAQLRDILKKEAEEARRRKARPAALEDLRRLEEEAMAAGPFADVKAVLERARAIAEQYPGDPEVQAALSGLEQRLNVLSAEGKPGAEPGIGGAAAAGTPSGPVSPDGEPPDLPPALQETPSGPEPDLFATLTAPPPAPPRITPPATPPPEPAPEAAPVERPAVPPVVPRSVEPAPATAARRTLSPALKWGIIGGAGVAAIILLTVLFATRKAVIPVPGAVQVQVRTTPPGAVIRVDGKIRGRSDFELELPPGEYQIEASLEGYQPAVTSVNLAQAGIGPVELSLQPLRQTVRLFSDLANATVKLNDEPPLAMQEGQLILDGVPPGKHTLTIAGRSGEATIAFELAPGAAPVLSGRPAAKNVSSLLVSNFGSQARIYTSLSHSTAEINGQPAGEFGEEGLELASLAPGQHELLVGDGKTRLRKLFEAGPAPSLTAFFQSDQNLGTVLILAGEDGADVYMDGRKHQRQTSRGGQLRIQREPREYRIRVAKEGFEDAPEQVVQIARGEEKKLQFKLVPLPRTAQLAIQGAAPGAQVFLSQKAIGTVQADGTFRAGSVGPGEHVVELRLEKRRSRPLTKTFIAGQTVQLSGGDIALRSDSGTLRLSVSPAGAQVSIARAPGGQPRPVTAALLELEEGDYTLVARAPGHLERTEKIQIAGGETATIEIALAREPEKTALKPRPTGMEGWESPGDWTLDAGWHVRRGGGNVLFKQMNGPGTYALNAMVVRGRHLEWMVGFTDNRNYVLFRLDRGTFYRIQSVNGRRSELVKKNHGLPLRDQFLIRLQTAVAPGTVVLRVEKDGQWVVLDSWTAPERDFTSGRFGLNIGGRDEVRLSGFAFHPRE